MTTHINYLHLIKLSMAEAAKRSCRQVQSRSSFGTTILFFFVFTISWNIVIVCEPSPSFVSNHFIAKPKRKFPRFLWLSHFQVVICFHHHLGRQSGQQFSLDSDHSIPSFRWLHLALFFLFLRRGRNCKHGRSSHNGRQMTKEPLNACGEHLKSFKLLRLL